MLTGFELLASGDDLNVNITDENLFEIIYGDLFKPCTSDF